MKKLLKRIVSRTPQWFQNELKRLYYGYQIKKGTFKTDEPEFGELDKFVSEGDWVIDIGANVGHYTMRLSELVGSEGRVIAFEPIPTTFSHLSENTQYSKNQNITLINAAVSGSTSLAAMAVPHFASGLKNYYEANIVSATEASDTETPVLTLPVDGLGIHHQVKLIKIDAEGHEPEVFRGLQALVERDRPVLIVETVDDEIRTRLEQLEYRAVRYENSPNTVFRQ